MKSAIPLIADLERGLFANRLLHGRCPLVDVLRCLMWIERRKACHSSPNNCGTEIETSEVFGLKPTSENFGVDVEFVGWRPSRNYSTDTSRWKWSVSIGSI